MKNQDYYDSLDPDSVDCSVSTRWAKVTMVAADVRGDRVSFTKRNLMIKTEARFRSEHLVMCGYSYAVTEIIAN